VKGNATPLFEDTENRFGWAIPSLDGSRVAYWKQNLSSKVWLLRDFLSAPRLKSLIPSDEQPSSLAAQETFIPRYQQQ
jgi:hypothetical protein